MKCSKCNAEIDDNARFCPECGNKIEKLQFCANCGAKLEEGATFCSNCGEKVGIRLDENVKAEEENSDTNLHFLTHEPNFFQKILQVYWILPKAWLLKEFKVSDGNIYISVKNGNELKAPIKDCSFYYDDTDRYGRMVIKVEYGEKKIKFCEIPFMLSDEEWERIINFCLNTNNPDRTTSSKIGWVVIIISVVIAVVLILFSLGL